MYAHTVRARENESEQDKRSFAGQRNVESARGEIIGFSLLACVCGSRVDYFCVRVQQIRTQNKNRKEK